MTSRRASPTPRRVVAIKHADGEPLTRVDIQYDLLDAIFSNSQEVFTNPYPSNDGNGPPKITFKDLYIKSIFNSPKATKALKDKMTESAVFAQDFAMLSLLVNVGRVNTTMSFFPEMKTTIRTYHPVPSLQRTSGNMQDAPRIKHILKTSLLEMEAKNPPATPADILARCKASQPPSTSITNLIFVAAHHTGPIGQAHFQGTFDFLDIFLRTNISSASRAKAFLWLCFNYLEAPASDDDYDEEIVPNPFTDEANKSAPPSLVNLSPEEAVAENRETEEDRQATEKLLLHRTRIVQMQGAKELTKASNQSKASINGSVIGDEDDSVPAEDNKGKRKRGSAVTVKGKKTSSSQLKESTTEREPISYLANFDDGSDDNLMDAYFKQRSMARNRQPSQHSPAPNGHHAPYRRLQSPAPSGATNRRYSPYELVSSTLRDSERSRYGHRSRGLAEPRTMLQQAWHTISSSDPLVDSDDEHGGDEYAREDYVQRLRVIDRLSRHHWKGDSAYLLNMDVDAI